MSVKNNMDLEEEIAMLKKEKEESIEAKVKLYNEWWKLKKENEIRFDKIKELEKENGISKIVHHQNMGLLEDLKKLKEENKDLTKNDECIEEELKNVEDILRFFGGDNKLPSDDLECTGCRIRQIANFVVFMIKGIADDNSRVVEATPVN